MSETRSTPTNAASSLVLALTLILGASLHLLSAIVFSIFFTVTMVVSSVWVNAMGSRMSRKPLFYSSVAIVAVVVSLCDVVLTFAWPEGKKSMGIFLPLLALNPLLYTWTDSGAKTIDVWIGDRLKLSAQFAGLTVLLASVRDLFGEGKFLVWKWIPVAPFAIVELSSGAFLLAAAGVVLFRWIQKRRSPVALAKAPAPPPVQTSPRTAPEPPTAANEEVPTVLSVLESPAPEPEVAEAQPQARTIAQAPEETPLSQTIADAETERTFPAPSSETEETVEASGEPTKAEIPWGERLESVFEALSTTKSTEKKRLLVIGSGTGELVYYLAMLGLEAEKTHKNFQFRVRGVDAFAARVDASLEGIFREHQLDFVPFALKQTYLLRSREGDKHLVRVANGPRIHIEFEVADFLKGRVFFYKPCDVIVLGQSLDYLSPEKRAAAIGQIEENLVAGGALVLKAPVARDLLPDSFQRTGDHVFRKK